MPEKLTAILPEHLMRTKRQILAMAMKNELKSPYFIHNIVREVSMIKSCDGVRAGATVVLGV